MRRITCLVGILIASLCLPAGLGGQAPKPRLAVKTFDNPSTSQNTTLGNALTDIFFTELGRTGRFQMVDRLAFEGAARDVDFGSTDWATRGTFASEHAAVRAEFILFGKVTNFSFQEHEVQQQVQTAGRSVTRVAYQQDASVRVDFRIVSTSTGIAVVTESGLATLSTVSAASESATYRRVMQTGVFNAEALDSQIGRATIQAINDAVRKVNDLAPEIARYVASEGSAGALDALASASGQVTGVQGDTFFVNVGSSVGLQRGDYFVVLGELLTRNARGDVIYREQQELGTLEVVDVSMREAAKARLLGLAPAAPRAPQEGDSVRIDMTHAKALRGGGPIAGLPGMPGLPGAAGDEYGRFMRQGDRYFEDTYYSQAADEYRRALALRPDSLETMDHLAGALINARQLGDADDVLSRLFAMGGSLSLGVVHNHFFDFCVGTLIVSSARVSYQPTKGDHAFSARSLDVLEASESTVGPLPALTIKIRDVDGKQKRYDFVFPAFLRRDPDAMQTERAFSGDAQALSDTAKVHRLIIRVVEHR
jgi:curli biogenesis system outer membrane secretion channel CsgG